MSTQLAHSMLWCSVLFVLIVITQGQKTPLLESSSSVDLNPLKRIANGSSTSKTDTAVGGRNDSGKFISRQEVDGPATVGDWWTFIGTWSGIYTVIIIVAFGFAVLLILIWIVWSWFFYGLNGGLYSPVYGAYGRPANYNNSGRGPAIGRSAWEYLHNYDYNTIHSILNSIEGLVDLYNNVINTST